MHPQGIWREHGILEQIGKDDPEWLLAVNAQYAQEIEDQDYGLLF